MTKIPFQLKKYVPNKNREEKEGKSLIRATCYSFQRILRILLEDLSLKTSFWGSHWGKGDQGGRKDSPSGTRCSLWWPLWSPTGTNTGDLHQYCIIIKKNNITLRQLSCIFRATSSDVIQGTFSYLWLDQTSDGTTSVTQIIMHFCSCITFGLRTGLWFKL